MKISAREEFFSCWTIAENNRLCALRKSEWFVSAISQDHCQYIAVRTTNKRVVMMHSNSHQHRRFNNQNGIYKVELNSFGKRASLCTWERFLHLRLAVADTKNLFSLAGDDWLMMQAELYSWMQDRNSPCRNWEQLKEFSDGVETEINSADRAICNDMKKLLTFNDIWIINWKELRPQSIVFDKVLCWPSSRFFAHRCLQNPTSGFFVLSHFQNDFTGFIGLRLHIIIIDGV